MKKYINIFLNIVMGFIIVIASLVTLVSLNTKQYGISKIGKIVPVTIHTETMEPTLKKDDLILTKTYDNKEKLAKGDIITFLTFKDNKTVIETHRIYNVINDGGLISYQTKGDNTILKDDKILIGNDIISVYKGNKIPYAGRMLDVLKSKNTFFLIVIVPLFLLLGYFTFDAFSKEEEDEPIKD